MLVNKWRAEAAQTMSNGRRAKGSNAHADESEFSWDATEY
jgi:hypothetical protein